MGGSRVQPGGLVPYGQRITDLARLRGPEIAFVWATQEGSEIGVPWAQVESRSNQVARLLESLGVGRGDLVVVALPNSDDHVYSVFGAWKLGANVLPLRWDLPAWEAARVFGVAAPKVVVGSAGAGLPLPTLSAADIKRSRRLDDRAQPPAAPTLRRIIASSGSTGFPKLVATPQPGLIDPGLQLDPMYAVGEEILQLITSPLYHTNGFMAYEKLLSGSRLILMERFAAPLAVELIERHRVNHVVLVPTMLQRIAQLPEVRSRDFSSLASVFYGGGPLAPWVARAWFDLVGPERFFFQYGGTEGLGSTMADGREWLAHEGTVGRPLRCSVRILDKQRADLPAGEIGEIFLRRDDPHPSFYYIGADMPERTADGYTTYGDLGWRDGDGYLYIADRRVDMIVSGGANVFPAEVEHALSEHPDVADAVVIGLPDPEWGQRVHAVVQPTDAARPPAAAQLREHCKTRIAAYKVPKGFEFVERIPRTEAGKINRSSIVAERRGKT